MKLDQTSTKWPKMLPTLDTKQKSINDDFMKSWHEVLAHHSAYKLIENFNQNYSVKHAPKKFLHTLEIGAGLGEHIKYEKLNSEQRKNYVALELRENMATELQKNHPWVKVHLGDCQESLPFLDNSFDRILAIHLLEHLPNLPATIKEMHRLCHKQNGCFSVVIPCEGGIMYSLARRLSAQRIFERNYNLPYKLFIEREHINTPAEILCELKRFFYVCQKTFFPFFIPSVHLNLCIGLTLKPKMDYEM